MKVKSLEILLEERRDRALTGKIDGTYRLADEGDQRRVNGSIILLKTERKKGEKDKEIQYYVTMARCSCPDFYHRVSKMRKSKPNARCKHQVILATLR